MFCPAFLWSLLDWSVPIKMTSFSNVILIRLHSSSNGFLLRWWFLEIIFDLTPGWLSIEFSRIVQIFGYSFFEPFFLLLQLDCKCIRLLSFSIWKSLQKWCIAKGSALDISSLFILSCSNFWRSLSSTKLSQTGVLSIDFVFRLLWRRNSWPKYIFF